ncbi:MAG: prephenate dehydratase domain-containing protein [Polyangiaceae bacterium]
MSEVELRLRELRERIAEADSALLRALEQRLSLSLEVQPYLAGNQQDVGRDAWADALVARVANAKIPAEAIRAVLLQVRAEATALEQPTAVAYLGPEGGLGFQVAQAHFGRSAELVECPSIARCLEEVSRGRATFAVFPFESSEEGLSQSALDALANSELVLTAERRVPYRLDLVNQTGNLGDIEKLYLTAHAHTVCEQFLRKELPKATVLDVRSPVVALQLVSGDAGAAAIVPSGSELGEYQVVRGNVSDEPDMRYRFGIATARPSGRSGRDTTALLFSVDDTAGALFDVLRHFAERGVNLKMLQSRPVKGENWDYLFYVELSGHVTDRSLVTAIESVKRSTRFLKVLGSFPSET